MLTGCRVDGVSDVMPNGSVIRPACPTSCWRSSVAFLTPECIAVRFEIVPCSGQIQQAREHRRRDDREEATEYRSSMSEYPCSGATGRRDGVRRAQS